MKRLKPPLLFEAPQYIKATEDSKVNILEALATRAFVDELHSRAFNTKADSTTTGSLEIRFKIIIQRNGSS